MRLLEAAGEAGLLVWAEGETLKIRGPRRSADLAQQLIDNRPDVMALLKARERRPKSASWSDELAELIRWFQDNEPELPRKSFQLRPAVCVTDPLTLYASLRRDISYGPASPRAVLGGLQADLRSLRDRISKISMQDG